MFKKKWVLYYSLTLQLIIRFYLLLSFLFTIVSIFSFVNYFINDKNKISISYLIFVLIFTVINLVIWKVNSHFLNKSLKNIKSLK